MHHVNRLMWYSIVVCRALDLSTSLHCMVHLFVLLIWTTLHCAVAAVCRTGLHAAHSAGSRKPQAVSCALSVVCCVWVHATQLRGEVPRRLARSRHATQLRSAPSPPTSPASEASQCSGDQQDAGRGTGAVLRGTRDRRQSRRSQRRAVRRRKRRRQERRVERSCCAVSS